MGVPSPCLPQLEDVVHCPNLALAADSVQHVTQAIPPQPPEGIRCDDTVKLHMEAVLKVR